MNKTERDEIFKAINNVSKKVNDIQKRLDEYFGNRCDVNEEGISVVDSTMQVMTEEIVPEIQETTMENSDVIDMLMTEILPQIMEIIEPLLTTKEG